MTAETDTPIDASRTFSATQTAAGRASVPARHLYIGIDPGASGAAVYLHEDGRVIDVCRFVKCTEHDVADVLWNWQHNDHVIPVVAYLESVHAMPKQGVSSTFKFGQAFGFVRGVLTALKIPYGLVTPAKWQRAMGCLAKGDKKVLKAAAQRLFPAEKVLNDTADAYLIAEYCRRMEKGDDK